MKYRELVKNVASYSGFSDAESEMALNLVTEKIASRLDEEEREDFASQLPAELQDIVLLPEGTSRFSMESMYDTLSRLENISSEHAKKQVVAVWRALKDAISPGEIADIRSQLPRDMASILT